MAKNKNTKSARVLAALTYFVALVAVVLAFTLPIFVDTSLFKVFIPFVNGAFGTDLFGKGQEFIFNTSDKIFIQLPSAVNLYNWTVVLTVIFGAVGIVALLPVCLVKANGVRKFFIYGVEICLAIVSGSFVLMNLYVHMTEGAEMVYAMVLAFGGVMLALVLQTLIFKKASGFMKTVIGVLSVAAVLVLADVVALFSLPTTAFDAINGLIHTETSFVNAESGFDTFAFFLRNAYIPVPADADLFQKIALYGAFVTVALVLVNFAIDAIALCTTAKQSSKVFGLVRYLVEFLAAVLTIVFAVLSANVQLGVYLVLVCVIAFVQLILSIIRVSYGAKMKKKFKLDSVAVYESINETEKEIAEEQAQVTVEVAAEEQEPVEEVAEEQAQEPAPAPTPAPASNYNPAVKPYMEINPNTAYTGPIDAFIATLTDNEKKEFQKVFIDKAYGEFPNVPTYVVGEQNKAFFSAVFIYLNKFRNYISAGLLNKIYKQLTYLK